MNVQGHCVHHKLGYSPKNPIPSGACWRNHCLIGKKRSCDSTHGCSQRPTHLLANWGSDGNVQATVPPARCCRCPKWLQWNWGELLTVALQRLQYFSPLTTPLSLFFPCSVTLRNRFFFPIWEAKLNHMECPHPWKGDECLSIQNPSICTCPSATVMLWTCLLAGNVDYRAFQCFFCSVARRFAILE